jgi:hypothetical protein
MKEVDEKNHQNYLPDIRRSFGSLEEQRSEGN